MCDGISRNDRSCSFKNYVKIYYGEETLFAASVCMENLF
jgi:hypothetical protein